MHIELINAIYHHIQMDFTVFLLITIITVIGQALWHETGHYLFLKLFHVGSARYGLRIANPFQFIKIPFLVVNYDPIEFNSISKYKKIMAISSGNIFDIIMIASVLFYIDESATHIFELSLFVASIFRIIALIFNALPMKILQNDGYQFFKELRC